MARSSGKIRGDPVAEAFARPLASRQVRPRSSRPAGGVAMKRRILELALALACAVPALAGCESLHHVFAPIRTPRRTRWSEPAEHPEVKSEAQGVLQVDPTLGGDERRRA